MNSNCQIPKTRKRTTAETARQQDDGKAKATFYVSADPAKRFTVHATYTDPESFAIFAEMISGATANGSW